MSPKSTKAAKAIRAIVRSVCGSGQRRYAVTRPYDPKELPRLGKEETITFSIKSWKGSTEPKKGQVVVIRDIQEFNHGWRAASAEPVRL